MERSIEQDLDGDSDASGSLESGLSSRNTVARHEKQRRFSKSIYENRDGDNDWDDGNAR